MSCVLAGVWRWPRSAGCARALRCRSEALQVRWFYADARVEMTTPSSVCSREPPDSSRRYFGPTEAPPTPGEGLRRVSRATADFRFAGMWVRPASGTPRSLPRVPLPGRRVIVGLGRV